MRQNEKDMDLKAKIKAMETAEEEDFGSSSISILRWRGIFEVVGMFACLLKFWLSYLLTSWSCLLSEVGCGIL